MPTINQLVRKPRKSKVEKSKSPALNVGYNSLKRVQAFLDKMQEKELDGIIINNLKNVYYLTGFWSEKFCCLCLEFEAMSHGGTERTEDY